MTRFAILFAGILIALFAFELTPWGQTYVVVPFTGLIAEVTATLLQLWDTQVASQGKIIWDTASGFAISIEAGCNGVEAAVVLSAAILAFPAAWQDKALGLLIGLLSVQVLNLVRVITLFYLGQWNQAAFEWAHLYVWQALIMLDVLIVFLLWLRWLASRRPGPAPAVSA